MSPPKKTRSPTFAHASSDLELKEEPYRFVVRLPPSMRDRIMEAARHYRRSMNSEIVARLQHSFGIIPDEHVEAAIEPPLHPQIEQLLMHDLSEDERRLLRGFRRLNDAKQAALIKLLG